jgi:hypothetical protein
MKLRWARWVAVPAVLLIGAACSAAPAGQSAPDAAAPDAAAGAVAARDATPAGVTRTEDGVFITPEPSSVIRNFSTRSWDTDFTRHTVDYNEIISGGPGKDGIPAIDRPRMVPAAEAASFLDPAEPVLSLEIGGEARAYPLQILIWHEIVNDTLGGEPVAVTYCPLCNTALVFPRTFEGDVLDFGTTGNLRFSDLVMYDRQTETWWQQASGEAIVGVHAGKRLEFLPASVISYEDFLAAYPDGTVLSRETGFVRDYGRNPYTGYDTASSPFLFSGPEDGRLAAMERVVAVTLGGEAAAYAFTTLADEGVVNDEVGGRPIVVVFQPGAKSALDAGRIESSRAIGAGVAFFRELDGRTLTFEPSEGGFTDVETGSRWDVSGRAVDGELAGSRLEPVVHGNHFWFAWAVFQPDTRVYTPD